MRLLIDTNIFLEVILDQEKAADAKALLAKTDEHEFFISDYSLHSIGLLLFRRKQHDTFRQFIADMILNVRARIATLPPEDVEAIIGPSQKFNLDFDDAYQYAAADKYDLIIVSFDSDFDRTGRGRKAPAEVLS